jgi:hypothetical protein
MNDIYFNLSAKVYTASEFLERGLRNHMHFYLSIIDFNEQPTKFRGLMSISGHFSTLLLLRTCQIYFQVRKLGVNFATKMVWISLNSLLLLSTNICLQTKLIQALKCTCELRCELHAQFLNLETSNWYVRNELGIRALKSDLKSTIREV